MAKSIVDRVIDAGVMMVARELFKDTIKNIKPKIQAVLGNKKPAGKRRNADD